MGGVLQDRKALVTGAGRGIGRAIAIAFAEAGADVALAARTLSELAEVKDRIEALGRRAVPIQADMGDRAEVLRLADRVLEGFGGLDILVNNAAMTGGLGPVLETSDEKWHLTHTTNFLGPLELANRFAPHFFEKRSGNIINISSIRGTNGVPGGGAYAAAKAALNSLTRTLACEWGPMGVRVNAILPGPVDTLAVRNAVGNDPTLLEAIAKLAPLARWTLPEDCAGPAVFLASDAARAITGHLLVVDGGLTAKLQDCFLAGTT